MNLERPVTSIERVTSDSLRITETGPMPCHKCRRMVWFVRDMYRPDGTPLPYSIAEKIVVREGWSWLEHACPVPKSSETRTAA